MDTCIICNDQLDNGKAITTLQEKGCEGINRAAASAGESLGVKPGQKLHKDCRRDITRNSGRQKRKAETSSEEWRQSLCSSKDSFIYKEHCLFCGTGDRYSGRKKEFVLMPVRRPATKDKLLDVCESRGDSWAEKVRSRLEFVSDLHAGDAVYHTSCNSNFRTGRQIPGRFWTSGTDAKKLKVGRPKDVRREEVFLQVVESLQDRDEEQMTVHDLITEMTAILSDSEGQAYGLIYMKNKLYEHFGDKIIITEIDGKKNVVTFREKAAAVLCDFIPSS